MISDQIVHDSSVTLGFYHYESLLHNSWMVSFWALATQFIKCVKMTIYLFGRHKNMTLRNVMSVTNDKYIFMIEMFFISAWLAKLTIAIYVFVIWSNVWKLNNDPRQKEMF